MVDPPSPPFIAALHHGGHQDPRALKRIVLHSTVSNTYCGGARAIARYFQNPTYVSSAHYAVDPCEVIQMVNDWTIAWHDGTNTNSLGVEMCEHPSQNVRRWNAQPHHDMLRRSAALVRQLCQAYGIPMRKLTAREIRAGREGICGHNDMAEAYPGNTSHWDPGAFPWDQFLTYVSKGAPAPVAPGGIEDMALDTGYKDWAGNSQTVQSWMNNVDKRVWRIEQALFGHWESRIPNDTNTTNIVNAIKDTTAWQAQDLGATVENGRVIATLANLLGTEQQLDVQQIKDAVSEALAEGTVNVDVTVTQASDSDEVIHDG